MVFCGSYIGNGVAHMYSFTEFKEYIYRKLLFLQNKKIVAVLVGWGNVYISATVILVHCSYFCSAGRSGAVVPVLILLFIALWFVLRGGLFCVLLCVVLFLCFSVLLALRLPRSGGEGGGGGGGRGGWS